MVEYSPSTVTSSHVHSSGVSVEELEERKHVEVSDSIHGHSLDVPILDAQSVNC